MDGPPGLDLVRGPRPGLQRWATAVWLLPRASRHKTPPCRQTPHPAWRAHATRRARLAGHDPPGPALLSAWWLAWLTRLRGGLLFPTRRTACARAGGRPSPSGRTPGCVRTRCRRRRSTPPTSAAKTSVPPGVRVSGSARPGGLLAAGSGSKASTGVRTPSRGVTTTESRAAARRRQARRGSRTARGPGTAACAPPSPPCLAACCAPAGRWRLLGVLRRGCPHRWRCTRCRSSPCWPPTYATCAAPWTCVPTPPCPPCSWT